MVYISSHNIISSIGFNTYDNLENIRKNISGIRLSEDKKLSPEAVFVSLISDEKINKQFAEISSLTENYTKYEKLLIYQLIMHLTNLILISFPPKRFSYFLLQKEISICLKKKISGNLILTV